MQPATMTDPPHLLKPTGHTSGQSPSRQRLTDDILAHLGPATAVDSLTTATGELRACLSGASMMERDFAMRTAIASKTIWEWVHELQDWPWPAEGGTAGFEMPSRKHKRLSIQVTAPEGEAGEFMGSLRADEVAKCEARVAEIQQELEALGVEEIKTHVLNNHILPLSRPGTPLLGPGRLSSTYNKMEDISAVITSIVVQALPYMARLSRLLQIWSLRFSLLRRVPPLLLAIEDAEVALKSGWNAISVPSKKSDHVEQSTLTRRDFDVMKLVLEKKISKPGRSLDYMLDCLEGQPDTLPEEWLDRMEAVEHGYSNWVAACEKKIRETEWAEAARSRAARSPSPQKKSVEAKASATSDAKPSKNGSLSNIKILPVPLQAKETGDLVAPKRELRQVSETSEAETIRPDSPNDKTLLDSALDSPSYRHHPEGGFDGTRELITPSTSTQSILQSVTPSILEHPSVNDAVTTPVTPNHSFSEDINPLETTPIIREHPPAEDAVVIPKTPSQSQTFSEDDQSRSTPNSTAGDSSPELPPLPALRHVTSQGSVLSQASTIVHGTSSHFGGLSSDLPEVSASPDLPRTRIREAEYLQASPPSSPPMRGVDSRESSVTPFDSPLIIPNASNDDFIIPTTSLDESYDEDFDDSVSVISEFTVPFDRRDSTGDQQLRQQISQIIESIPAKIKLAQEPPAINLNPPDLHLPRLKKKPSVEPFRRSTSSLSSRTSRAATPSFTLSPAKNTRARSRGQQEIKVYHLSRSTGEAPIKLFIRCVGEQGQRVMVRVGGGWADLGEYLKEYASHHKRRSAGAQNAKVEVRDLPRVPVTRGTSIGSSPPVRPASALELSPMTPLTVRKTRRSVGAMNSEAPRILPRTPALTAPEGDDGPSSEESNRSRSSSHMSWAEDDSSFLGLAGPTGKKVEMSEENRAWVESVKDQVRLASGERKASAPEDLRRFGELGKVGGTKRLFRKSEGPAGLRK